MVKADVSGNGSDQDEVCSVVSQVRRHWTFVDDAGDDVDDGCGVQRGAKAHDLGGLGMQHGLSGMHAASSANLLRSRVR